MALYGHDRDRIETDQAKALEHPMRLRIIELFTKDEGRSMAAESLAADLVTSFPGVKLRQVAYHVAVLRDAQLIPSG